MKPTIYAQQRKQELTKGITQKGADMIFESLYDEPWLISRNVGDVPCYIPAKYYRLLRAFLITAYLNAMFKKASQQYSVEYRHNMLRRALMYTGNVRESAGR